MRTLGPLSTSLWPSSRAPPDAAISVTGKVTAVTGKLGLSVFCAMQTAQRKWRNDATGATQTAQRNFATQGGAMGTGSTAQRAQ